MCCDVSPAKICPVEGEEGADRTGGDVGPKKRTAADEIVTYRANKAEHHHVCEEMLILYMTEYIAHSLEGSWEPGYVHEEACHDGPEGHYSPCYSGGAVYSYKGGYSSSRGREVGENSIGG